MTLIIVLYSFEHLHTSTLLYYNVCWPAPAQFERSERKCGIQEDSAIYSMFYILFRGCA